MLLTGHYLLSTTRAADATDLLGNPVGDRKAISVTIGSFAQGVSGKLETGDVVSAIVYSQKDGLAFTPPELQYLMVITSTTNQGVDEININSWDDITLSWSDGHMEKLKEHFHSPGHAVDIVKRLLHHSGMIIDNAAPIAQGHLPDNTRITALKSPVVDEDCGISVSIRLLHPQRVDRKCLIDSGMATKEMMEFLEMCIRYGVSLVVAGRTSSGKTTLLNALLASIPDDKRISLVCSHYIILCDFIQYLREFLEVPFYESVYQANCLSKIKKFLHFVRNCDIIVYIRR